MEGVLNKIGRFFVTKEPGVSERHIAWMQMMPPSHSGEVKWDDFIKLQELIYGTAYTCIDLRSRAESSIPLKLYTTQANGNKPKYTQVKELTPREKEWIYEDNFVKNILAHRKATNSNIMEVTEHPALDLLTKVNKKLTQSNLKYLIISNLLTYGNGFLRLFLDNDKKPEWIRMMDTCQLDKDKIKQRVDGEVESYTFGFGDGKEVIPGKEIIHFFFPTVKSRFLGLGPLAMAAPEVNVERSHALYVNSNFKNMGRMGGLISLEGAMSEAQRETYEKSWNEKFTGAHNAGKFMVTKGGEVKITPLGTTAQEMALDTTWRYAREAIANRFMIPLSILTMESSNRAVALQGSSDFWTYAGWPDLTLIHEELTESLLPFYDESLFFLHENPIPEDIINKIRETQANLNTGKTTINEEREKDNLESVDGGDVNLVPMNLVPLNMAGVQPQAPQPQDMKVLAEQIIKYIENS